MPKSAANQSQAAAKDRKAPICALSVTCFVCLPASILFSRIQSFAALHLQMRELHSPLRAKPIWAILALFRQQQQPN